MKKVAFKQEEGIKLAPRSKDFTRSDSNDPESISRLAELGLLCPLSKHIFRDPVTLPTGITYERRAIEMWLQEHRSCPVTGQTLTNPVLNTNLSIKQKVFDWARNNRPQLIDQNKMELKPLDDVDISFKSEFGQHKSFSHNAKSKDMSKDLSKDLSTIHDDYNPLDSIQARYNQNKTPSNTESKLFRIPTAQYFGPDSNENNNPQTYQNTPREIRAVPNLYENDSYEGRPLQQRSLSPPPQGYSNGQNGRRGYNALGGPDNQQDHGMYNNYRSQQDIDRDMAYAIHLQDEQQRGINHPNQMQPPYNYPQRQQGYYNNGLRVGQKQPSNFQASFFSHPTTRYTIQYRYRKYSWIVSLFFVLTTCAFIAGQVVTFYFNAWRPISLIQQPLIGGGPLALLKAGAIRSDQYYYNGTGDNKNINKDVGFGSNIETSYSIINQWYTILTSLWLFSGVYQLVVGTSTMWLAVNHLRHILSWWKLIGLFLISGIVGNMAGAIFAPKYVIAGAPSLVFGLLGALIAEMTYHMYLYRNIFLTTAILLFELGVNIVINLPPSGNMWGGIFSFIIGALMSTIMFKHFKDKSAFRTIKGILVIIGKSFFGIVVILIIALIAASFGSNNLLGARNTVLQTVQCPQANWWDCTQGLSLSCSIQRNGTNLFTFNCINQQLSKQISVNSSLTDICVDLCNMQSKGKNIFSSLDNNNNNDNNINNNNNNGGSGNSGNTQGFVPSSQGPASQGQVSGNDTGPVPLPNQILGNSRGFVPASKKL